MADLRKEFEDREPDSIGSKTVFKSRLRSASLKTGEDLKTVLFEVPIDSLPVLKN